MALTFLFLTGQLVFMLFAGVVDFIILSGYIDEHIFYLITSLKFCRIGLYFSQNMALFINIHRWVTVLMSLKGLYHAEVRRRVQFWLRVAVVGNILLTIAYLIILVLHIESVKLLH